MSYNKKNLCFYCKNELKKLFVMKIFLFILSRFKVVLLLDFECQIHEWKLNSTNNFLRYERGKVSIK